MKTEVRTIQVQMIFPIISLLEAILLMPCNVV